MLEITETNKAFFFSVDRGLYQQFVTYAQRNELMALAFDVIDFFPLARKKHRIAMKYKCVKHWKTRKPAWDLPQRNLSKSVF